jgi:hypothetical protein
MQHIIYVWILCCCTETRRKRTSVSYVYIFKEKLIRRRRDSVDRFCLEKSTNPCRSDTWPRECKEDCFRVPDLKITQDDTISKKDPVLMDSKEKVTPDKLYTATPTWRFMNECKTRGVNWAIFSDKYGIWFSDDLHEWCEKNLSMVTKEEFSHLLKIAS